jgi:glutamyl-tRNA synthetase
MGFLPEALNNYLVRLGWSHGDDEISAARDGGEVRYHKLGRLPAYSNGQAVWLNAHYIKTGDPQRLATF